MAGSLAVLHRERGERSIVRCEIAPCAARSIVLMTSTLCRMNGSSVGTVQKEIRGLFQSAAGVEQNIFARDFDPHPEIVVGLQIVDNHVGKVMHIDDHFAECRSCAGGQV